MAWQAICALLILMDQFDPLGSDLVLGGWSSLLILGAFVAVGSFFLGALYTAVRRGMKEEGWFKFKKKEK